MSAGDLVVADHQYEYNGLLIGSLTPYMSESWDGLFDITSIRDSDLEGNDRDGSIPGTDFLSKRTITGKLHLLADNQSDLYDHLEAFQSAFRSQRTQELPFVYKLPNRNLRFINCRPRKSSMPKDYDLAHGHGVIDLQLLASDPRHYELIKTQISVSIPNGATTATVALNSFGNYMTEPVITLNGLATNPIITMTAQDAIDGELDTTGHAIRMTVNNSAVDTIVIDTNLNKKTIQVNGANAYNIRNNDSQWWRLMPGTNNITVTRASSATGSGCTFTFAWYDAFNY